MELSVLRYLPVIVIIGLLFGFIWKNWSFFRGVLSDGTPVTDKEGKIVPDKDGNPIFLGSTTRVLAFLFGLGILMCEIYTTMKTEKFDIQHLYAMLLTILILVGLLKTIDAIGVIRGTPPKQND